MSSSWHYNSLTIGEQIQKHTSSSPERKREGKGKTKKKSCTVVLKEFRHVVYGKTDHDVDYSQYCNAWRGKVEFGEILDGKANVSKMDRFVNM